MLIIEYDRPLIKIFMQFDNQLWKILNFLMSLGGGVAKVWGHAVLENIEILHLQRCVLLHSEVSGNLSQLPKKDNFYRQFNHDLIPVLR